MNVAERTFLIHAGALPAKRPAIVTGGINKAVRFHAAENIADFSRLRAVDQSDYAFPFRCLPLLSPLRALVARKTLPLFLVASMACRKSQFAFV
jgi:hypothetical protein